MLTNTERMMSQRENPDRTVNQLLGNGYRMGESDNFPSASWPSATWSFSGGWTTEALSGGSFIQSLIQQEDERFLTELGYQLAATSDWHIENTPTQTASSVLAQQRGAIDIPYTELPWSGRWNMRTQPSSQYIATGQLGNPE